MNGMADAGNTCGIVRRAGAAALSGSTGLDCTTAALTGFTGGIEDGRGAAAGGGTHPGIYECR